MNETPLERDIWRPSLGARQGPLYLAIVEALERDTSAGRLRPGERLPTQRALAAALGCDLTTVTRAYAEARRRGLIEAVVGRGSFVAETPGAAGPAVDMSMNLPPVPPGLDLPALLATGLEALGRQGERAGLLTYRPSGGTAAERAAASLLVEGRTGPLDPSRVLLAPGGQAALVAALTTLARPGDIVLAEDLAYLGFRAAAGHLGLQVRPVATDGEGLLPDALDAACRAGAPRLLYCVPTAHNPTTATMGEARRRAVLAVAARHGLPVVEDDAYGLLAGEGPPPLAALDPDRVIHLASLAKCLSPALRLAAVVAPPSMAGRLAAALRAVALMTSPLMAALLARWIEDGTALRVIRAVRREAAERQRLAARLLPAACIAAHPRAHHLWLRLPRPWTSAAFLDHMRAQGLALVPASAFATGERSPEAVRIALGAAPDQPTLERALTAVARTLDSRPDAWPAMV
ncbi:PLP-dependent aminotransferase family protein [Geminicoccaceae bacterium 1502E]|nr:PLP-dependent aminotransferase family protein [Geminicoccaceae bacterium 1502E]